MDAFGNLTSVLEPDPTCTTVMTNYAYDVMNHLTQVSRKPPRSSSPSRSTPLTPSLSLPDAENSRNFGDSELARGFESEMPINHFAVTANQTWNLKAELTNR